MNIIFPLIIHELNYILQFKFELSTKYAFNEINNVNIVNVKDNFTKIIYDVHHII